MPQLGRWPSGVYTEDDLALMRRGLAPTVPENRKTVLRRPAGSNEDEAPPTTTTDHRQGNKCSPNKQYFGTNKTDEIDDDDVTIIWLALDDSRVRFACVFEATERNGYIYLYHFLGENDLEILGAQQVCAGAPDFAEEDVEIRWYDDDTKVGVVIKGELGAYFDLVAWQGCPGTYWATRKARAVKGDGDPQDETPQSK